MTGFEEIDNQNVAMAKVCEGSMKKNMVIKRYITINSNPCNIILISLMYFVRLPVENDFNRLNE